MIRKYRSLPEQRCVCQSIEERETKTKIPTLCTPVGWYKTISRPRKERLMQARRMKICFQTGLRLRLCSRFVPPFRMLVCITPLRSFRTKVETDEVNPDRWDCCNARLLRLGRRMYGPALADCAIVQFVSLVAVARLLNSGAEIDLSIERITMGFKRCCNETDRQLIVAFRSQR
jgi:hypothetical protein